MKVDLNTINSKVDIQTTGNEIEMGMSKNVQSIIFKMFIDKQYSNPIGSVVREITSNCYDSHAEAGVNDTVIVRKTFDAVSKQHYISFIDVGIGMSPQRVKDIYGVFFESSKRDTNDQIGGFGIGGKTPLAYKRYMNDGDAEYDNSFFVITISNGIKYTYCIYEGKKSPVINLLQKENTTERNGTEEYKAEYAIALDKLQTIEQQIKNRAIQLCEKFSHLPITNVVNNDIEMTTSGYLYIIEAIEQHNQKAKQTSLYDEYDKKQ